MTRINKQRIPKAQQGDRGRSRDGLPSPSLGSPLAAQELRKRSRYRWRLAGSTRLCMRGGAEGA